jgi:hypothetical protein
VAASDPVSFVLDMFYNGRPEERVKRGRWITLAESPERRQHDF